MGGGSEAPSPTNHNQPPTTTNIQTILTYKPGVYRCRVPVCKPRFKPGVYRCRVPVCKPRFKPGVYRCRVPVCKPRFKPQVQTWGLQVQGTRLQIYVPSNHTNLQTGGLQVQGTRLQIYVPSYIQTKQTYKQAQPLNYRTHTLMPGHTRGNIQLSMTQGGWPYNAAPPTPPPSPPPSPPRRARGARRGAGLTTAGRPHAQRTMSTARPPSTRMKLECHPSLGSPPKPRFGSIPHAPPTPPPAPPLCVHPLPSPTPSSHPREGVRGRREVHLLA